MALDLEDAEEPSAQVDGAGVLAWTDGDRRPARRQRPQELLRMLVRTVLAPHRAEHRPLELVRLATDEIANEGSLVFGEARVLWNLVRLRRFRRPQGRGRTHVREIAPRGAIKEKSSATRPARQSCRCRDGRGPLTDRPARALLPSLGVHACYQEPQAERSFAKERGQLDPGDEVEGEGGCEEIRDAVREVRESAKRQQDADHPRKEGRPEYEVSDADAIAAKEDRADAVADLRQVGGHIGEGLGL